jgi:hypothetical protein
VSFCTVSPKPGSRSAWPSLRPRIKKGAIQFRVHAGVEDTPGRMGAG